MTSSIRELEIQKVAKTIKSKNWQRKVADLAGYGRMMILIRPLKHGPWVIIN